MHNAAILIKMDVRVKDVLNLKKYNNYDLHFHFELKNNSVNFINAEYIHPLKQDLVQAFQDDFKRDSNIKAVIVFGSSVEFRCNSYSDLDLCIERYDTDQSFHCLANIHGEEVDVVYADRIGHQLRAEIEKHGIVVYDREGKYV